MTRGYLKSETSKEIVPWLQWPEDHLGTFPERPMLDVDMRHTPIPADAPT